MTSQGKANDGVPPATSSGSPGSKELPTMKNPPLTSDEQKLLQVYDELEQTRLECALLRASKDLPKVPVSTGSAEILDGKVKNSEQELLDVKAAYSVRNRAIESVLTTSPSLNVARLGENSTAVERKLAACIHHRDELSQAHTELYTELAATNAAILNAEVENIRVTKKNAELADELFKYFKARKARLEAGFRDAEAQSEIESLKEDLRSSRLKRRILKSVVSAMVAGSGLNWAEDERLRELVLDDEEEDDTFDQLP